MTTGHSENRTPVKHSLLDCVLGKHIGAAPHVARKNNWAFKSLHLFDLAAGDGVAYHGEGGWARACSPGIMARYGLHRGCPGPVSVHLFERAKGTHARLIANLADELPSLGYVARDECTWVTRSGRTTLVANSGDSRELADFDALRAGDWAFINNDPNSISDWALNGEALGRAVDRGAVIGSFHTMGCNPGGLKRLPQEMRADWWNYVRALEGTMRRSQDLVLMAIDRDDAQWAYLSLVPRVWAGTITQAAHRVFQSHDMEMNASSCRQDRNGFEKLLAYLFLTKKEREDGAA